MYEKKGHMRVIVDLEVNDELMEVFKDTLSKASTQLPELLRRNNTEKNNDKATC